MLKALEWIYISVKGISQIHISNNWWRHITGKLWCPPLSLETHRLSSLVLALTVRISC